MNRSDRSSSRAELEAIEERAADWLGRRDGGLTAPEEAEFSAWLAADPRHRRALARLESASSALDALAAFKPSTTGAAVPDPDLPLRPRSQSAPARPRRLFWVAPTLAAAAAVALAFVAFRSPALREGAIEHRVVATEVGSLRSHVLPDGSRMELNTDTVVKLDFTPSERRVALVRGEAHFTVMKNASRPFIVDAGGVGVRAVGTAFNVRLRGAGIDVLVTEGRVRVDDSARGDSLLPVEAATTAEPPVLSAGQRVVVSMDYVANRNAAAPVVVAVNAPEVARLLAWQEQRLEFDPSPLREIVAEFNRYNRHRLVVADDATGELSVGGSFRANDYETLVRLLEKSFGIQAERRGGETVLRKQP